jgi:hypothetical protein
MISAPFESIISLHGDYAMCLDIFPAVLVTASIWLFVDYREPF